MQICCVCLVTLKKNPHIMLKLGMRVTKDVQEL
jgi:hypothetical protein